MGSKVRIPTALRKFTGGQEFVEAKGSNIREIIDDIETKHPGIRAKICDNSGALRRFVNIYLDGDDIRFLSGLDTETPEGKEISIVPSIAGG